MSAEKSWHPNLTRYAAPGGRIWHRRMRARSTEEAHRPATPLELFFDLCFVVAIALAAARLHHALTENHVGEGVLGFALVFFAIWWAWMNFTWFASAFDTDDGLYRVTTMVQMAGVLVLAAGIPRAFDDADFGVVWLGYLIMRVAMITHWLRVAQSDAEHRPCALRYAAGIALCQLGWALVLIVGKGVVPLLFLVLALCELAVPVWAERVAQTTWHPHHIAERYGLFTIIVLGESILAATTAMQAAIDAGGATPALVSLAIAGLVIVFSMWWLYFSVPAHDLLTSLRVAFVWGYGHFVIFASAAAVGAGLEVAVDFDTGETALPALAAGWVTAVPVAVFLLSVWLLHIRACPEIHGMLMTSAFPVIAGLILLSPFTHAPIHVTAGLLVMLVTITVITGPGRDSPAEAEAGTGA